MTKPKIVVTSAVFPETAAFLAEHCDVDLNNGLDPWPEHELLRRCAAAEGMLAFMTDRVDGAFLAACPVLRVIACALKGWDNFDRDACTAAGVHLTIVPDLLTEPTAELAIGLALALGRNILAGDNLVRRGRFRGWRPSLYGVGLANSVVGIAGAGQVGQAIARRVRGFGPARILYHDNVALPPDTADRLGMQRAPWLALIESCDVLFMALPLSVETRGLLGRDALERIKPGCLVINVGRGSVVDEEAVAEALAALRLGGYAADVFEMEDWALDDRRPRIPQALLDSERTVFTPHLGSGVSEVRWLIEMTAAQNLVDALEGRAPAGAINQPATRV
jgi:phosphonate dehydrogenase